MDRFLIKLNMTFKLVHFNYPNVLVINTKRHIYSKIYSVSFFRMRRNTYFWPVTITPHILGKCSSFTYGVFGLRVQRVE